ncbi:hypothetical protein B0H11DRAFT_1994661 [Mycena galericulata]|nr:hypothetical protein B0H11DRAFT_1994661 [Mycena galericulata]
MGSFPRYALPHTWRKFVGYLLHWGLFGTLNIQLFLYYQAFPNDRLFNKCLVYTVYALEFIQTMLITYAAFETFGYRFGDLSALGDVRFEWFSVPVMSGIVSFLVAFIGQSFYAYRLFLLSKSRWLPLFIVVIALMSSIGAFLAGSFSFKVGSDLPLLHSKRNFGIGVWLGGAASTDIIITAAMSYYLWKSKTGFRETHALVSRLIRLTIETGSVTAVVAIIDFTLFFGIPDKPYFIAAGIILPKLYANTILAVLNARFQIAGGRGSNPSVDFLTFPNIRNIDGPNTPSGTGPVVAIHREVFTDRDLGDIVKMTDAIKFRRALDVRTVKAFNAKDFGVVDAPSGNTTS